MKKRHKSKNALRIKAEQIIDEERQRQEIIRDALSIYGPRILPKQRKDFHALESKIHRMQDELDHALWGMWWMMETEDERYGSRLLRQKTRKYREARRA